MPSPRQHLVPGRVWPLAFAAALCIAGCTTTAVTHAPQSRAPQWRSLFDGRTLNGWTPKIVGYPAGQDPLQTFRVRNGAIVVDYADYGGDLKGRVGHLYTREAFRAYRLSLDYRFVGDEFPNSPRGVNPPVNNGVMFHAESAEQMELNQPYPISVEAQLVGPDPQGAPRTTGNLCERAMKMYRQDQLLPHCVVSSIAPKPLGAWIHLELEVNADGGVIETIDGVQAAQVDRMERNPDATDVRLPIKAFIAAAGGRVQLDAGHIAFQSEGHPTEFRNVRILPLE